MPLPYRERQRAEKSKSLSALLLCKYRAHPSSVSPGYRKNTSMEWCRLILYSLHVSASISIYMSAAHVCIAVVTVGQSRTACSPAKCYEKLTLNICVCVCVATSWSELKLTLYFFTRRLKNKNVHAVWSVWTWRPRKTQACTIATSRLQNAINYSSYDWKIKLPTTTRVTVREEKMTVYLLERRSMLLSGREKLESTVQKESDMIPVL